MKCQHASDLFSDLHEGALSTEVAAKLEEHLAGCTSCASEYASFEEALGALQALGTAETSDEVRSAILSAVDSAAREESGERDESFRRAALVAQGRTIVRERRSRVGSHAVAVLMGAAAVYLLFFLWPWPTVERIGSDRELANDSTTEADSALDEVVQPLANEFEEPEQAEQFVAEVEVREVIRYVEKRVEVPVEVPVEVEVERLVYRGPLFEVDTTPLADVLGSLVAGLDDSNRLRERELLARAEEDEAMSQPELETLIADAARPLRAELNTPSLARRQLGASVSVRREGGQVQLLTRGPLAELVPVLLSRLDDEDEEIVALVERQLENIRQRAHEDQEVVTQLTTPVLVAPTPSMVDRLLGRRDVNPQASWEESWRAWWAVNRELLIEAEDEGYF